MTAFHNHFVSVDRFINNNKYPGENQLLGTMCSIAHDSTHVELLNDFILIDQWVF